MEDELALNNVSIVVTRPVKQNKALCSQLLALGATPIAFPCIEINPIENVQSEFSKLSGQLGMAIFISTNAVEFGLKALPELKKLLSQNCQIAAVGASTGQALREHGIDKVITPSTTPDSEELLKMAELQAVKQQSVLIVKGVGGRTLLQRTLENRGAQVYSMDVYERTLPKSVNIDLLSSKIDLILFTSNECVDNFLALTPKSLQKSLLSCHTIVGHPRIAEKVTSLGFENLPIIAATPSDTEMLAAIQKWANSTKK